MRHPLSIAQVTDQLNVGGAEQMTVLLANLLQAHGHTSTVVVTVAPGPLAAWLHPEVGFINLKRGWKWNPVTMYRMVKLLKQYDVIHVHSAHNLRYVYLANRLFFLRKPIFYHEHHGALSNTQPGIFHRYLLAQTQFIAVSEKLAHWAKTKANMPAKKVFLLPNTVIKQPVNARWQPNEVIRLCTVGNILPNKNQLFALRLLAALQQQLQQPVHLTVFGQIADVDYYRQLQTFIAANQQASSVLFVHDCTHVQERLPQFTSGIHCALSESGPLVLIEYLAQGLPFVAYRTGEVAEQLQPYLPANFLNGFELEKWVDAIKGVFGLRREDVGAVYHDLYTNLFSTEAYYTRCIAIYTAALQKVD